MTGTISFSSPQKIGLRATDVTDKVSVFIVFNDA